MIPPPPRNILLGEEVDQYLPLQKNNQIDKHNVHTDNQIDIDLLNMFCYLYIFQHDGCILPPVSFASYICDVTSKDVSSVGDFVNGD